MLPLSPAFIEFLSGGSAAMLAEVLTLPFDSIKVQIMMEPAAKGSLWLLIKKALSTRERFLSLLMNGLDAALIRQLVFGTLRFGLYPVFQQLFRAVLLDQGVEQGSSTISPTSINFLSGFLSGATAAAICNPTDLVKVRIQGRYKSVYPSALAAFFIIYRDEGLGTFWTGVWPTVYRASILAAVELSVYYDFKTSTAAWLNLQADDYRVFVLAALVASFFSAIVSCPFDVARSRMMNQSLEKKERRYRHAFHCLYLSVKEEGVLVLWNGVWSYLLRLGTVLALRYHSLRFNGILIYVTPPSPHPSPAYTLHYTKHIPTYTPLPPPSPQCRLHLYFP